MTWLIFEDGRRVSVLNVQQITAVEAFEFKDGVKLDIWQADGKKAGFSLKDKKQLETLINVLEMKEGWYYIKDGEVKLWKGAFETDTEEVKKNEKSENIQRS